MHYQQLVKVHSSHTRDRLLHAVCPNNKSYEVSKHLIAVCTMLFADH